MQYVISGSKKSGKIFKQNSKNAIMKYTIGLTKSDININNNKYSLLLLTLFSLLLLAFVPPDNNKTRKKLQEKEQGIILNIPADALMNHTK